MQYRITKVYLVDAQDRIDARRQVVAAGETHLKIISIQELKAPVAAPAPAPIDARPASRYGEPYRTRALQATRSEHDGDRNPA